MCRMPDQKPSRLSTDERDTLRTMLQFQRDSLVRKVTGVAPEAAATSAVGSGTSLLWLVRHLAQAELMWVVQRFAGRDDPLPADRVAGDTLDAAIADYREAWIRVDAIVAASGLEETC